MNNPFPEAKNKQLTEWHLGETSSYQPGDWVWLATRDIRGLPECKKVNV